MDEKIKKMIEGHERYAKLAGIKLNPNENIVKAICNGLMANEKKHGARYCPCRIITGKKEEDTKIICPCVYHKDEIKEMGHCHCNLFVR